MDGAEAVARHRAVKKTTGRSDLWAHSRVLSGCWALVCVLVPISAQAQVQLAIEGGRPLFG